MIYIQIIVLSFIITLHKFHICTIRITLVSQNKSLGLQLGLTQLDLSVYSSLHIILLGKSVYQTKSGAAYKLKPGSSIEYFFLSFSYNYFLPAWSRSTPEAWNLTRSRARLVKIYSLPVIRLVGPMCENSYGGKVKWVAEIRRQPIQS